VQPHIDWKLWASGGAVLAASAIVLLLAARFWPVLLREEQPSRKSGSPHSRVGERLASMLMSVSWSGDSSSSQVTSSDAANVRRASLPSTPFCIRSATTAPRHRHLASLCVTFQEKVKPVSDGGAAMSVSQRHRPSFHRHVTVVTLLVMFCVPVPQPEVLTKLRSLLSRRGIESRDDLSRVTLVRPRPCSCSRALSPRTDQAAFHLTLTTVPHVLQSPEIRAVAMSALPPSPTVADTPSSRQASVPVLVANDLLSPNTVTTQRAGVQRRLSVGGVKAAPPHTTGECVTWRGPPVFAAHSARSVPRRCGELGSR
jgi:hypothetical protein